MSSIKANESYIRPGDISSDTAKKILNFLNKVESEKEMLKIVNPEADFDTSEKGRKNDLKIAQRILDRRRSLGAFHNLEQLINVSKVGPATFSRIIRSLSDEQVIASDVEKERREFKALLLKNPNYFGTAPAHHLAAEKPISNNMRYEELVCLGFNPRLGRLEAVVLIKRDTGYRVFKTGENAYEYINFYADWDDNGAWQPLGKAKFTVADAPGPTPLAYAVGLDIDLPALRNERLIRVRGILSWNLQPAAETPGFTPVWGNVLEGSIHLEESVEVNVVKPAREGEAARQIRHSQSRETQKAADLARITAMYRNSGVPEHRYAFLKIWEMMAMPQIGADPLKTSLRGFTGDPSTLIENVLNTSDNVSYEEIVSIGFDPARNELAALLRLKQPRGYAGARPGGGSLEYVAFWACKESEKLWSYLGTTAVDVADMKDIPAEGLDCAVFIPLNTDWLLEQLREENPMVKVLAILSWEVPPQNIDWKPVWGNQMEATISFAHCAPLAAGAAYLNAVGDTAVDEPTRNGVLSVHLDDNIKVSGFIAGAPNLLAGDNPYKYSVVVRNCLNEITGAWTPWERLTSSFVVTRTKQDGFGPPIQYDEMRGADPLDEFFTYGEQSNINQWAIARDNLMARWQVPDAASDLWEIRLDIRKPDGSVLTAAVNYMDKHSRTGWVRLRLVS